MRFSTLTDCLYANALSSDNYTWFIDYNFMEDFRYEDLLEFCDEMEIVDQIIHENFKYNSGLSGVIEGKVPTREQYYSENLHNSEVLFTLYGLWLPIMNFMMYGDFSRGNEFFKILEYVDNKDEDEVIELIESIDSEFLSEDVDAYLIEALTNDDFIHKAYKAITESEVKSQN